jgi:hypothetical protein
MAQRGGAAEALRVMGVDGPNGSNLARAQAKAEIEPPDEAVAEGGLAQGEAPKGAGRVDADDRESDDPVDDGVRTRCGLDAEGHSQARQDAGDSTTANASDAKELERDGDHVTLGHGGESAPLGCKLTQAGLRLFEGWGGPVAFGSAARMRFALGTLSLAALRGLMFPWISPVVHCGELAHDGCSGQRDGPRPSHGMEVRITMSP